MAEIPLSTAPAAAVGRGRTLDPARAVWLERLGVAAILAIAAAARLPGLASRGQFDSDQGHDMTVLMAFVHDGVVPLLGPRTSVGDFHHGAFYYFLLAPAAAISNGDPVAVTLEIALLGIGAVALTWWLARSIGGPIAGLVAGLLLAVSPGGIAESTFIWNPNPIPFFAALSLAAAWRGHATGRARWWVLALGAAGAVMQLHLLGAIFLIGVGAIYLLELGGAPRGTSRSRLSRGGLGGILLVALLFAPLAVHELQTGFLETHRIVDYLTGSGGTSGNLVGSFAFTLLRLVGWPLVGLVTDAPTAAAVVLALTLVAVGWTVVTIRGPAAIGVRWLVGLATWSAVGLSLLAPSLQTVVAGLPNDHYHAFLDPVVAALLGISAARLAGGLPSAELGDRSRAAIASGLVVGVLALVGLEVARWPSPDPDGGWAAAQAAGQRVVLETGGGPAPNRIAVLSTPDLKLPDGIGYPIARAGGVMVSLPVDTADAPAPETIVVVCDRLFEPVIGAPCGGPAEGATLDGALAGMGRPPGSATFLDRFDASPRTAVSIYRLSSSLPGSP
jgi:Dolichyl-phosphate-mannose-protein mannosyltransferase